MFFFVVFQRMRRRTRRPPPRGLPGWIRMILRLFRSRP
jgi:hypothetical protein